jgi:hypothetical protein
VHVFIQSVVETEWYDCMVLFTKLSFVSFQLEHAVTTVDQKTGRHVRTTRLVPVFVASIVLVGVVVWKIGKFPVPK